MNAGIPLAIGAAAGADRSAFGQTLLSHPAVIAALCGWAAGVPREGAWLGLALTLFSMPHQPVGRERLRDWPSAAVAACFGGAGHAQPWAWGAALGLALVVAWVGGAAIAVVRRVSSGAVDRLRAEVAQGDVSSRRLTGLHLACGGLELARGAAVSGAGAWGIAAALSGAAQGLPVPEQQALVWFWRLAPLVALPLALRLRLAGAPRGWLWPGLAVGVAAAWVWGGQP